MKKQIILFILLLLPIVIVELILIINDDFYKSVLLNNSELIEWSKAAPKLNKWPETIIMGSSIAKEDLDPSQIEKGLSIKGKNTSIGSITINADSTSTDYLALKRILATCKVCPKRIIYQVTEASLRKHEHVHWKHFTLDNIKKFYYPDSEIDHFLKVAAGMDENFSEYNRTIILQNKFRIYTTRGRVINSLFNSELSKIYPSYEDHYYPLFDDRDSVVYGFAHSIGIGYTPLYRTLNKSMEKDSIDFYSTYLSDYQVGGVTEYFINNFLQLAQDNNIKIYLIIAPETHGFLTKFSKEKNLFKNQVRKIAKKHKLRIIDDSETFSYDYKLFGDAMHMNKKGSEIYSFLLGEKLTKYW